MTKPFQPDMSGCIDIAEHHPDLGIWVAFEDDKVWLSRDDWEKVMARNEELACRLDEAKAEIERMKPVVEAVKADCDLAEQDKMRPELQCDCDVCKALRKWQEGK